MTVICRRCQPITTRVRSQFIIIMYNTLLDDQIAKFKTEVGQLFTPSASDNVADTVSEYLELLLSITNMENSSANRQGQKKAQMISDWLQARGVNSKVTLVPPVSRIPTSQKEGWYIVEASIGSAEFVSKGKNAVIAVHHDQVSHEKREMKIVDGILHSPTILDDSINVAAAMFEFVNFNKWYENNKGNIKENFCVKLLVTDGEEVNTQGIRSLLEVWSKEKKLEPLSFMIVGEATGRKQLNYSPDRPFISSDIVPGVAYVNRGKVTGDLFFESDESVYKSSQAIFSFLRVWQEFFHTNSHYPRNGDGRETPVPSQLIPTLFSLDNGYGSLLWEVRTNKKIGAKEAYRFLENALIKSKHIDRQFKVSNRMYKCKMEELFSYDIDSSGSTVQIDIKDSIHPGTYVVGETCSPMAIAMFFLAALSEADRNELVSIKWGDPNSTNVIPRYTHIKFKSKIAFDATVNRLIKPEHSDIVDAYIHEGVMSLHKGLLKMKIVRNESASCRESLEVDEKNWDLVEQALEHINGNVKNYFNSSAESRVAVFNAMHDGGPTSYDHIHPIVWANGERLITIGTGNFDKLHGDESLSPAEVAVSMVQYRGLLQKLLFPATI